MELRIRIKMVALLRGLHNLEVPKFSLGKRGLECEAQILGDAGVLHNNTRSNRLAFGSR